MTTQDLKDNREEILEQMDFVGVHPSMKKEFMKTMVDFVEMGINETEDVCDFVNQIFNLNDLRNKEWKGKTISQAQLDREYLATAEVNNREKLRDAGKSELEISRSL